VLLLGRLPFIPVALLYMCIAPPRSPEIIFPAEVCKGRKHRTFKLLMAAFGLAIAKKVDSVDPVF